MQVLAGLFGRGLGGTGGDLAGCQRLPVGVPSGVERLLPGFGLGGAGGAGVAGLVTAGAAVGVAVVVEGSLPGGGHSAAVGIQGSGDGAGEVAGEVAGVLVGKLGDAGRGAAWAGGGRRSRPSRGLEPPPFPGVRDSWPRDCLSQLRMHTRTVAYNCPLYTLVSHSFCTVLLVVHLT